MKQISTKRTRSEWEWPLVEPLSVVLLTLLSRLHQNFVKATLDSSTLKRNAYSRQAGGITHAANWQSSRFRLKNKGNLIHFWIYETIGLGCGELNALYPNPQPTLKTQPFKFGRGVVRGGIVSHRWEAHRVFQYSIFSTPYDHGIYVGSPW